MNQDKLYDPKFNPFMPELCPNERIRKEKKRIHIGNDIESMFSKKYAKVSESIKWPHIKIPNFQNSESSSSERTINVSLSNETSKSNYEPNVPVKYNNYLRYLTGYYDKIKDNFRVQENHNHTSKTNASGVDLKNGVSNFYQNFINLVKNYQKVYKEPEKTYTCQIPNSLKDYKKPNGTVCTENSEYLKESSNLSLHSYPVIDNINIPVDLSIKKSNDKSSMNLQVVNFISKSVKDNVQISDDEAFSRLYYEKCQLPFKYGWRRFIVSINPDNTISRPNNQYICYISQKKKIYKCMDELKNLFNSCNSVERQSLTLENFSYDLKFFINGTSYATEHDINSINIVNGGFAHMLSKENEYIGKNSDKTDRQTVCGLELNLSHIVDKKIQIKIGSLDDISIINFSKQLPQYSIFNENFDFTSNLIQIYEYLCVFEMESMSIFLKKYNINTFDKFMSILFRDFGVESNNNIETKNENFKIKSHYLQIHPKNDGYDDNESTLLQSHSVCITAMAHFCVAFIQDIFKMDENFVNFKCCTTPFVKNISHLNITTVSEFFRLLLKSLKCKDFDCNGSIQNVQSLLEEIPFMSIHPHLKAEIFVNIINEILTYSYTSNTIESSINIVNKLKRESIGVECEIKILQSKIFKLQEKNLTSLDNNNKESCSNGSDFICRDLNLIQNNYSKLDPKSDFSGGEIKINVNLRNLPLPSQKRQYPFLYPRIPYYFDASVYFQLFKTKICDMDKDKSYRLQMELFMNKQMSLKKKIKRSQLNFRTLVLGTDRFCRSYLIFYSLDGLFVQDVKNLILKNCPLKCTKKKWCKISTIESLIDLIKSLNFYGKSEYSLMKNFIKNLDLLIDKLKFDDDDLIEMKNEIIKSENKKNVNLENMVKSKIVSSFISKVYKDCLYNAHTLKNEELCRLLECHLSNVKFEIKENDTVNENEEFLCIKKFPFYINSDFYYKLHFVQTNEKLEEFYHKLVQFSIITESIEMNKCELVNISNRGNSEEWLKNKLLLIFNKINYRFISKSFNRYSKKSTNASTTSCGSLWQDSVNKSTSMSQLVLALLVIESHIEWQVSIIQMICQLCGKSGGKNDLITCNLCNHGYHKFCFKTVPENTKGEWICYTCQSQIPKCRKCMRCGGSKKKMAKCKSCQNKIHYNCAISEKPTKNWFCGGCLYNTNFNELFKTILNKLKKNKNSWPFLNPVDTIKFPSYLKIITKPIDFRQIDCNITQKKYLTPVQFKNDIYLVFDNCGKFHKDDSSIYSSCITLRKLFNTLWNQHMHHVS
ncbi:hypothetical protein A3Q56_05757 [Intoshia linei]|uniref:Uncharacterized protein n=1 Tax=Intoshia linei TaxID=1819745 RepID=A0A177AYS1_9BILA|nr:hypothetical protein A3Q56_05757 [Intoshia linei]